MHSKGKIFLKVDCEPFFKSGAKLSLKNSLTSCLDCNSIKLI